LNLREKKIENFLFQKLNFLIRHEQFCEICFKLVVDYICAGVCVCMCCVYKHNENEAVRSSNQLTFIVSLFVPKKKANARAQTQNSLYIFRNVNTKQRVLTSIHCSNSIRFLFYSISFQLVFFCVMFVSSPPLDFTHFRIKSTIRELI
jgi:hypothetical protein